MSPNCWTKAESRIAASPISDGHLEKPTEVEAVAPIPPAEIWLRGLEANITGIPKLSASPSACTLLAHLAIVSALAVVVRQIKWRSLCFVISLGVATVFHKGYGSGSPVNWF